MEEEKLYEMFSDLIDDLDDEFPFEEDEIQVPEDIMELFNTDSWYTAEKKKSHKIRTKKDEDLLSSKCIRSIQILMHFTPLQAEIIKMWMIGYNRVYNYTISLFYKLLDLNQLKTGEHAFRDQIKERLSEEINLMTIGINLPPRLRDSAITDVFKAYNSAMGNLSAGNIERFRLRPKKKNVRSMIIPGDCITKTDPDNYSIFVETLGQVRSETTINEKTKDHPGKIYADFKKDKKDLKHDKADAHRDKKYPGKKRDSRLVLKGDVFILFVPTRTERDHRRHVFMKEDNNAICAVDPGVRTVATTSDGEKYTELCKNAVEVFDKLHSKLLYANEKGEIISYGDKKMIQKLIANHDTEYLQNKLDMLSSKYPFEVKRLTNKYIGRQRTTSNSTSEGGSETTSTSTKTSTKTTKKSKEFSKKDGKKKKKPRKRKKRSNRKRKCKNKNRRIKKKVHRLTEADKLLSDEIKQEKEEKKKEAERKANLQKEKAANGFVYAKKATGTKEVTEPNSFQEAKDAADIKIKRVIESRNYAARKAIQTLKENKTKFDNILKDVRIKNKKETTKAKKEKREPILTKEPIWEEFLAEIIPVKREYKRVTIRKQRDLARREAGVTTKKRSVQYVINKRNRKIRKKMRDVRDDMHWKIIAFLVRNYNTIVIGEISTRSILKSKNVPKAVKRALVCISHYLFRMRLKFKCDQYRCKFDSVDEFLTSKSCSKCDAIKWDLGDSKVFVCPNTECGNVMDRDCNAADNIRRVYDGTFKNTREYMEKLKNADEQKQNRVSAIRPVKETPLRRRKASDVILTE